MSSGSVHCDDGACCNHGPCERYCKGGMDCDVDEWPYSNEDCCKDQNCCKWCTYCDESASVWRRRCAVAFGADAVAC